MLTKALARYLATRPLGLTHGTSGANLILGQFNTSSPADAVSLAPKTAPTGDLSDSRVEGLQIIVRWGTSESGCYEKADAIRDELNGLRHTTLAPGQPEETRLVWMRADDGGPVDLGPDPNGRARYSLRFLAEVAHDTALTIL